MNTKIKNPGENTDNTKKPEIAERKPDSEMLYIGCKDPVAVDLIKSVLGEKFRIFVLNKGIFNRVTEDIIKASVKWEQDQKILEYTKDPEKMHECLKIAKRVEDKVGASTWFTLSQFIDETNFTYKHAHSTMDLLFAFGFVAHDTKINKYLIVADPRVKLKYVEEIEKEMEIELKQFKLIKSQINEGVFEAEEAIKKVREEMQKKKEAEEGKVISMDAKIGEATGEENTKIGEVIADGEIREVDFNGDAPEILVNGKKPVKKRAPRKKKD